MTKWSRFNIIMEIIIDLKIDEAYNAVRQTLLS